MLKLQKFKHIFSSEFIKNIVLSNNVLYLNSKFGLIKFNMPNFFFYKSVNDNYIKFIFSDYHKYNMVFRQIKNEFISYSKVYFFKLKLRGLGYKITSFVNRRLIRFFFAYNHFFYLHVPNRVFFLRLKRKFVFFSNNLAMLNDLFVNLLRLKKMDFYERANTFIVPNKILYIKKRK
jgi:hypothetical protein